LIDSSTKYTKGHRGKSKATPTKTSTEDTEKYKEEKAASKFAQKTKNLKVGLQRLEAFFVANFVRGRELGEEIANSLSGWFRKRSIFLLRDPLTYRVPSSPAAAGSLGITY
jgi:hypothetical protein